MPGRSRPADDPMAADRRTLFIAVLAMIGLVATGVVSAALFTGSACDDIEPTPVARGVADAEVERVVQAAFPDADGALVAAIVAQLEGLTDVLGPTTGAAVVDGATSLVPTDDGFAAVGPQTSLVDRDLTEVLATVDVGSGIVDGSGDTLVSLARVNDLTGQVDAFTGIDARPSSPLTAIGCVDTATVGTPLAFELDAAGGQLLLFRAGEDGDDAEMELRDPREGRVWFARVDVGVAPPGVTGERIDALLGEELAVLVRRTSPVEDTPVVTAVGRDDPGTPRTLGRDAFDEVPTAGGGAAIEVLDEAAPQRLELLALDGERALVAITAARDAGAVAQAGTDELGPSVGPGAVVALDLAAGAATWATPLADGRRVLAATIDADERDRAWLVTDDGGQVEFASVDPDEGPVVLLATASEGDRAAVAHPRGGDQDGTGAPGRVAVVGEVLFVSTGPGARAQQQATGEALSGPLRARDVVVDGDRLVVLFAGPADGAGPGGAGRGLAVGFALE
ncbi:MAG: hypothetical protein JJT89_05880 [Nitriliruptoraceae bacterium]|nr:hypothetical protein [Nitriliruptoraceae bacterium]